MDKMVETGLSVIVGVWVLNLMCELLLGIDVIGSIVRIIKKWAGDYDDSD